ncbi:MAG: hypothetical protein PHV06_12090, partial [bacterium]|nr:hypothetical protein [bacterium]
MGFWDFLTNIFGTRNERVIEDLIPVLEEVNSRESDLQKQSDTQLREMTSGLRLRLVKGETVEDIMADAFALVREASVRVLKMRHFDVQVYGAIILHQGKISEMKTGEGKTLVATMPSFLNALEPSEEWLELAEKRWGEDWDKWIFEP